jgi:hypothetical protein
MGATPSASSCGSRESPTSTLNIIRLKSHPEGQVKNTQSRGCSASLQEPVFNPPNTPCWRFKLETSKLRQPKRKQGRAKPHELDGAALRQESNFPCSTPLKSNDVRARHPLVQASTPRPEAVRYVSLPLGQTPCPAAACRPPRHVPMVTDTRLRPEDCPALSMSR